MGFSISYLFCLGFLSLVFYMILPCTNAQTHDKTLYELTKKIPKTEIAHIDVGKSPTAIQHIGNEKVYVANADSNTVSAIDATTGEKIKDIPVGVYPLAMDYFGDTVYVANAVSNTVSAINATTDEKIKDIPVGVYPVAMESIGNTVFVANSDSNNVSAIDATTDEKIKDIPVGNYPLAMNSESNTDAVFVANAMSNNVSAINATTGVKIKDIPVGVYPLAMESIDGILFVANADSNTVSAIDATTGEKIKDIPVGDNPVAMESIGDTVFVANSDSNTVSAINATTGVKIKDIPVGVYPLAMESIGDTVFVANADSNTVSAIDATTGVKIKDIPVGDNPVAMESIGDTVFVANADSNTVSVIDGLATKVVAGVKFSVNPVNSGYIECSELKTPSKQYFYLYSGDQCTAKPYKGFEFQSWQENLNNNATIMLNVSSSSSTLDSILDIFNLKPDKPEATISITKFGSFTANIKELPPPLPPEYWAILFGFVITTVLGTWLIPSIIRWFKSRSDIKNLNKYHKRITLIYDDGKLDEKDIVSLNHLSGSISDDYSRGKINKEHYESLRNEVSSSYEEIFRKRLSTIDPSDKDSKEKAKKLQDDVLYAFSKGKIGETHYNILKEKIAEVK